VRAIVQFLQCLVRFPEALTLTLRYLKQLKDTCSILNVDSMASREEIHAHMVLTFMRQEIS
jgi:hypothetical protein